MSIDITQEFLQQLQQIIQLQFHHPLSNIPLDKSPQEFLIAYSGGLDSHVLLHLMSRLKNHSYINIRALHIHHGLQKVADSWPQHCADICDQLAIPYQFESLKLLPMSGKSLEAMAREARYKALKKSLRVDEVLLTAHHQDDQAETLLLQMFRGAGVHGLASMPEISNFGAGYHARPLLGFSRQHLMEYAASHDLKYINDPSNNDQRFERNFLRQTILPQIHSHWPGVGKVLSRVARIQAETKNILDEIAETDLQLISEAHGSRINISLLCKLSVARQKLVIRYWITQQGFLPPSEKKLTHLFGDVINAGVDATPILGWEGAEVRRYQDYLYLMSPLATHNEHQKVMWKNIALPLQIESIGKQLQPEILKSVLNDLDGPVTVRFRTGGEKVFIPRRGIHISLKKLFQEAQIPPWQRSRIPLVYSGEKLLLVAF